VTEPLLVPDDDPTSQRIFRSFVRDGRISALPARSSKRLVLLDHVARLFEPGERFPEPTVNSRLRSVYDDYVSLRRFLVDAGYLSREAGVYWRSGGTVAPAPDDDPTPAP
jgi:hypothetical protein